MYIPKNRIKENQYTKGSEFEYKDSHENYVGYYCSTSNGKFFSNKTLNNTSKELIKTPKNPIKLPLNTSIFNKITGLIGLNQQIELKPSIIKPTQQDYDKGFITRYFAKKIITIDPQIFEINQRDFNNSNQYLKIYQLISLEWKITGPKYDITKNKNMPIYGTVDTNMRTLELKEKEMSGITRYFDGRLNEFAKND